MKILENTENPLLRRTEVRVIVEESKNPGITESLKKLAEHFKVEEDRIALKKIKGKFGRNTFMMQANIYKDKESRDKTEPKKKEKKQPGEVKN